METEREKIEITLHAYCRTQADPHIQGQFITQCGNNSCIGASPEESRTKMQGLIEHTVRTKLKNNSIRFRRIRSSYRVSEIKDNKPEDIPEIITITDKINALSEQDRWFDFLAKVKEVLHDIDLKKSNRN